MTQRIFTITRFVLAALIVFTPALGLVGCKKEPENKVKSGLQQVGEGIKEGAKDAEKKTGEALKTAGEKVGQDADKK